jgi:hypothetical protein
LPLRVPSSLTMTEPACDPTPPARPPQPAPLMMSANGVDPVNLAVQITRTVPASGNLGMCGQHFWLGPTHAGATLTLWADTTVIHLLEDVVRLKTVPSRPTAAHLRQLLADGDQPAGPPPVRQPSRSYRSTPITACSTSISTTTATSWAWRSSAPASTYRPLCCGRYWITKTRPKTTNDHLAGAVTPHLTSIRNGSTGARHRRQPADVVSRLMLDMFSSLSGARHPSGLLA